MSAPLCDICRACRAVTSSNGYNVCSEGCGFEAGGLPPAPTTENQDEGRSIRCPCCHGDGEWETECCNGSGGCSCGGRPVDMGRCRVCGGSGMVVEGHYDPRANIRTIHGLHFIGSGPNGMHALWPNRGNYR